MKVNLEPFFTLDSPKLIRQEQLYPTQWPVWSHLKRWSIWCASMFRCLCATRAQCWVPMKDPKLEESAASKRGPFECVILCLIAKIQPLDYMIPTYSCFYSSSVTLKVPSYDVSPCYVTFAWAPRRGARGPPARNLDRESFSFPHILPFFNKCYKSEGAFTGFYW